MGRSRLMEQQRARMEARRARKKKEKKEKKEKEDNKKYGSGGKKATTRDTSKDSAKIPLVYTSANLERIKRGESPVDAPKKTALSKAVKATETATQKKVMPGGTTRAKLEKSFNKTQAINNFVGPGGSRTRADLKRTEAEYKNSRKPKRSDFPAGRSGAAAYANALRKYNKSKETPTRRSIKTFADRRRARRGGRN